MVKITNTINETRNIIKNWKKQGLSIGLVPTMGYLHEGHESLIRKAKQDNDRVIVSIFVNPTQFAPNEDLSTYPRNIERDIQICKEAGTSLIFNPNVIEMYQSNFYTYIEVNSLTKVLCGKSRPTHFRGVCTIVNKLFNITNADRAYFGEKDAQQLVIIKSMVKDLNIDIEIIGCPIVREDDGLAKSSRNAYLNPEERKAALVLNESLLIGKALIDKGERNSKTILNAIINKINTEHLAKIDYVNIVDKYTLEDVDKLKSSVLVAMAVFIGKTRLIDNFVYEI